MPDTTEQSDTTDAFETSEQSPGPQPLGADERADDAGRPPADAPTADAPTSEDAAQEAAPAAPERTFADFGVPAPICAALERAGILHPFPIQAMTLPVATGGHDIIGQAKTGTGKTLGFAIPLLARVLGPDDAGFADLALPGAPQALVVVPTRELAGQVARDVEQAGADVSARVLTVYGGRAYEPQVEALTRGVEIVVGTPGRLLDLAQQGHLRLGEARAVVLDEADEMLDLGFLPDVEKLLALTPAGRQTMLFSATMPGPVVALARRYMTQPTHIRAADPDDDGATVKAIRQVVYRAHAMDKVEVLARLLQARDRGLSIVFARTKRTAAKVADELATRGFAAAPLHGDLGQGAREQALRAFRTGKVDVLVATDVAARGIDVTNVTHVVNYQCPEDESTYLHRTGRTGRAGATGTAVTFVDWDDLHRWAMIDRSLGLGIPEPEETYSTSPHLFTELDIPAGTTGSLPRSARTRAGLDAEALEDLGETGRARQPARQGGHDGEGRGPRGGGRGARQGGRDGGREDRSRAGARDARPAADDDRRLRSGDLAAGFLPSAATGRVDPSPGDQGDGSAPEAAGAGTGRPRRRRRGGSGGEGGAPAVAGADRSADDPAVEGGASRDGAGEVVGSDAGAPPADGTGDPARRRRRRRGGRGRSGGAGPASPAGSETAAPASDAPASTED